MGRPSREIGLLSGLAVVADADAADLRHVVAHEYVARAKFAMINLEEFCSNKFWTRLLSNQNVLVTTFPTSVATGSLLLS